MKHLKLFEQFSSEDKMEIYPDDNSNRPIFVSHSEFNELVDKGLVFDEEDMLYNSDYYYDIMQMLGKLRK